MLAVVLSTPRTWHLGSWLIKYGTGFDASHAAIYENGLIFESTSGGVVHVNGGLWDEQNSVKHAFCLINSHDVALKALQEMHKYLGTDYDYLGTFGYGLRLALYAWFGILPKNPDTPNKLFCSELVARWLDRFTPSTSLGPDATTPAALSRRLTTLPQFKEVVCKRSLSATFT